MSERQSARRLLLREPWCSDVSGALYSPYSQYLQVAHDDLAPWLNRSGSTAAPDVSALQSLLHHEIAHWIQSHGTSIGALLSAWRGQQWDCFRDIPTQWGPEVLSGLLHRRFSGSKRPLIRIGRTGLTRDALAAANPSLQAWRLRWWRLQVAQGILENPTAVLAIREPFLPSWREALLAVVSPGEKSLNRLVRISSQQERAAREALGDELTTRDLIEAFASVNQLVYYTLAKEVNDEPWLQRSIDTTVASIAETSYGRALRRYVSACPAARNSIHRMLAHFCVVTDIALNPCLMQARRRCLAGEPADAIFREFYPPARFAKLCASLGEEALVPITSDDRRIQDYQRQVVSHSGLKTAESLDLRASISHAPHTLTYRSSILREHALADVEAYWQTKAFEIRKSRPSLFVLPAAQYVLGRPWVPDLLKNDQSRAVLLPPMMTDSRRHVYFGLPHSASHCLIFWSIAANAAHNLLVGQGPLTLAHFPEEVLDSDIAKDAIGSVFRHLGASAGEMGFRSGVSTGR